MVSALQHRCVLTCKPNEEDFQEEINSRQYDLVFLDIDSINGQSMQLLERIHGKNPFLPIIITSRAEKAELIVRAINSGASDYLVHPVSRERINISVGSGHRDP